MLFRGKFWLLGLRESCNCGSEVVAISLERRLNLIIRSFVAEHSAQYIVRAHIWDELSRRRAQRGRAEAPSRGSSAIRIVSHQPVDIAVAAQIRVEIGDLALI